MGYRIHIENTRAFLVLDEPMDTEPTMRSYYWPINVSADRLKEGPAVLSRLGCASVISAPASAGYRPTVEIPFDGKAQAERIESAPIIPPKTKRPIRYRFGKWETLYKSEWR